MLQGRIGVRLGIQSVDSRAGQQATAVSSTSVSVGGSATPGRSGAPGRSAGYPVADQQVARTGAAIVYGFGMIPITRMFHTGFVFDVIGVVLVVAGALLMANLTGIA